MLYEILEEMLVVVQFDDGDPFLLHPHSESFYIFVAGSMVTAQFSVDITQLATAPSR